MLGDDVNSIEALRPTVQLWSVVKSKIKGNPDEWISMYRGLVVDMENETTIELTMKKPKTDFGYTMIYILEGLNLIGVPRQAEALEVVGDFYQVLDGVVSVKGMADGEWIGLDDDTEINGETGYLVEMSQVDQYAVWGTIWKQPVSSAAPPSAQWGDYKRIATTWGAMKQWHQ